MKREVKGITLVALVITIIVLLILAGVSIAMLTGENGILGNAEKAIGKSENAQIEENATLADYENEMRDYIGGSRETVTITNEEYEQLKNDSNYSEEEKKVGVWMNGESVYKKTIIFTTPATNGVFYDLTEYNIKKIINVSGMVERSSDSHVMPLPYCSLTTDMATIYFKGNYEQMGFWTVNSQYNSQNAWVTIEYLKN